MNFEKFKEAVVECSREYEKDYKASGGYPATWEFSTSSENFEEKVDFLSRTEVFGGSWKIYKCSACEHHNPETPWHVVIEVVHDVNFLVASVSKHKREAEEAMEVTKQHMGVMSFKEFYPLGTLMRLVKEFEALVETPEQYDGYVLATHAADTSREQLKYARGSEMYERLEKQLMGDDQHD